MTQREVPPELTAAVLREYQGLEGTATLPGVGTTSPFRLARGGRQGGVDTPRELNMMIEALFQELVPTWESEGLGYQPKGSPLLLHHLWWADNCYLIGTSRG